MAMERFANLSDEVTEGRSSVRVEHSLDFDPLPIDSVLVKRL